jgi:hypothetical protein
LSPASGRGGESTLKVTHAYNQPDNEGLLSVFTFKSHGK